MPSADYEGQLPIKKKPQGVFWNLLSQHWFAEKDSRPKGLSLQGSGRPRPRSVSHDVENEVDNDDDQIEHGAPHIQDAESTPTGGKTLQGCVARMGS